jgi:Fe(3+) dicitrate transport protein
VSWIYRGAFFTDEDNTPFGGDPEGENGQVPSVWLLAARVNYTIPKTDAVLFVAGENLTDKLYITDREDGIKPGIGRTIMAGAKIKW